VWTATTTVSNGANGRFRQVATWTETACLPNRRGCFREGDGTTGMVDFQSRDTSRGLGDDEEDEEEETQADDAAAAAEKDAAADESTAESDTEPETGDRSELDDAEQTDHDQSEDDESDHGHEEHGHDEHSHDHGEHSHDAHDHGHDAHDHGDHDHGHDAHDHGHHAHDLESLGVAVMTISSSRTRDDDQSGDTIQAAVEAAGHEMAVRDVIRDNYDVVQNTVTAVVGRGDVDVVVTTGGTGVTPDDVTIEAVEPLFDKKLPGFGELFRQFSYEEIGTKVVGTRATAGIAEGVPVFCLPGSENAARLGIEELVLAEAPHLAGLATRDEDDS
jgi:molybdenum cofactor biosynthesis protein B